LLGVCLRVDTFQCGADPNAYEHDPVVSDQDVSWV
jgi:hypothetical protein